ncbi:glucose-6-phosphate isomerase [Siccirubricoccus deserti]|uniref:Glucose-6-phosphate isomerase n=1 Tax=Siccirubricoccus deserti TaxID=2013562 RepID=A0A9X0QYF1_9PROT|nr:glucose-6-phosphate isomerase [Siccirubricoccus deserti]MBC4016144.1 glucose-6-phosphate isomerase [Siccirubricoccus deserti]GGC45692.1 glucose-6-phosphate isomerase [Siccirubricoccus deserti]
MAEQAAAGIAGAWAEIAALAGEAGAGAIRPLFAADSKRFARFSRRADGLLLDLSKTSLNDRRLGALIGLARAVGLAARRDAMAAGETINTTEGRAVLHMALRGEGGFRTGEEDVSAEVAAVLGRMRDFCAAVHDGTTLGATGERFTDVLNIGIGGSDLGPAMVARALWTPAAPMRAHYLANVDAHAWEALRPNLDPARTLVLVASKTFTTQETMTNAALVRDWLRGTLGEGAAGHFAALSTNLKATAAFGIAPERVFPFRDWVGGRFSLWSAIGLSLGLALGWEEFSKLLSGARAMDGHFLAAPLEENLPVLLALAEIWHVNGLGYPSRAVLPYDERLARLPAHLQQLEMESLGKRVTLAGTLAAHSTGAVVFGEPGTNAQHSFMQLIHQGTTPVPCDIILVAKPDHKHADSHRKLLANGLAQAEALMRGKPASEVRAEMAAAGVAEAEIARLLPHRVFPGDRPSAAILLPHLDAFTLGQLVALYEHKVFCLGALWGINAFDQWGVELGKQLAGAILPELEAGAAKPGAHDGSTEGLLRELLGSAG